VRESPSRREVASAATAVPLGRLSRPTRALFSTPEDTTPNWGLHRLNWVTSYKDHLRSRGTDAASGCSGRTHSSRQTSGRLLARQAVTPNNVTLDGYALFDVRTEPLVVHLPALSEPRWYIVQIGDVIDEVIRNIGGTKGPRPGDDVITGPDFRGNLPGEMSQIRSRTASGVVALRVFTGGTADQEVIYPPCAVDSDGNPFSGQHRYVLRFPPGQTPPVSTF
jgi:hypothetical protein